ncbi:HpcH/HpaI aldolase/citrate lyase family protein [Affinibrenneria salicis]|uniref:HpcH/HpaI aldolase/citrate lyase family protein n=1 Tax=Affinibrenneria salicis TaxID=2590031 RepID=A0A5J5G0X9_9GAMM|nr:HpcH/HpaI aldolase/citrate lyase family protein [Affinibrenneria salicis]KAA8999994.1 HpcH/HpaI aldolase/citrate lyase family protein [Affinibrenneria salicis]
MKIPLSPHALGATLYMPATRRDIAATILANKIPGLRSLVICLEDAVADQDVDDALANLRVVLAELTRAKQQPQPMNVENEPALWPLIFIRPRHKQMGRQLVRHFDLSVVDGFVLPKFTQASLAGWWTILAETPLYWMPTLETEEVFDVHQMQALAAALESHPCRARILALRIGGNDLMNVISLRRSRQFTLYDSPMGYVIKMLVAVFGAKNFALTAPVCEHIDDHQLLDKELQLDLSHGLVGKTAIHPGQIEKIHQALMVSQSDHEDALKILNSNQAVFKNQGAMCEPATHKRWAISILARAIHYGIAPVLPGMDAGTKRQQQG